MSVVRILTFKNLYLFKFQSSGQIFYRSFEADLKKSWPWMKKKLFPRFSFFPKENNFLWGRFDGGGSLTSKKLMRRNFFGKKKTSKKFSDLSKFWGRDEDCSAYFGRFWQLRQPGQVLVALAASAALASLAASAAFGSLGILGSLGS